jgi:Kef-type K+ transport system membrane component KefB
VLSISLLLSILLILVLGKVLGITAERIGLPSIVGELLTGVILGPMVLGIILPAAAGAEDPLKFLASLGILFMMFIMGLSIDIENVLKTNAKSATSITLFGAAIVIVLTTAVMVLVGAVIGQNLLYSLLQGCLIGVGLTSTSTVIGFKYLTDLGDRFSSVFKTLVAVEITDGIFSIMALAVLLSIIGLLAKATAGAAIDPNAFLTEVGWSTFKLFLLMLGFIIFVIKFGGVVTDWLLGVSRKSGEDQSIITLSLIVLFAVATLSDWLELTYVIGAFLAGAILAGSQYTSTVIEPRIKAVGYGLFIPIFFAYTGISMDFGALIRGPALLIGSFGIPIYLLLFVVLLVIVMGGKYIGTIAGCALTGTYKAHESHRIGVSLMCAGEDALVIGGIGATVYFGSGSPVISNELLSIIGLVVIVSSLIAPIFIKRSFEEKSYSPPPLAPRTKTGLGGKPSGKSKGL